MKNIYLHICVCVRSIIFGLFKSMLPSLGSLHTLHLLSYYRFPFPFCNTNLSSDFAKSLLSTSFFLWIAYLLFWLWVKSSDYFLSPTDLFNMTCSSLGHSHVIAKGRFHLFLWLRTILLCLYTTLFYPLLITRHELIPDCVYCK